MLIGLGIATAVVVALYLLVTLMRGEPETETNAYVPAPTQAPAMSDKMPSKAEIDRETRKLLAELKTIPVSEFAINLKNISGFWNCILKMRDTSARSLFTVRNWPKNAPMPVTKPAHALSFTRLPQI